MSRKIMLQPFRPNPLTVRSISAAEHSTALPEATVCHAEVSPHDCSLLKVRDDARQLLRAPAGTYQSLGSWKRHPTIVPITNTFRDLQCGHVLCVWLTPLRFSGGAQRRPLQARVRHRRRRAASDRTSQSPNTQPETRVENQTEWLLLQRSRHHRHIAHKADCRRGSHSRLPIQP